MSKVIRLLLTLICLAVLVAPASSLAAAPMPPPAAERTAEFAPGGPGRITKIQAANTGLAAGQQASGAASGEAATRPADSWSRVAFQSYQGSNWDIYSMRPDGAGQIRLTKDAKVDARPQQSFADGAVAFISNRSGNFDIFTMAADGSDLRQVTVDSAEDNYPSWSPDGRRLAFASDRSGSWDVYTVNPDGSGLALFVGGPADDFGPAWSPDGQVIAWIRVSGQGVGRIWVANADGSNARELTTDQVFLENLTWSPDGTRIGFDADGTGDFFTDIAYIVYEPGQSLPTYPGFHTIQAPPMTDAMMGSFTKDGDILFSVVQYVEVGEELWIQGAALARMPRNEWHSVPELLPGAGMDMNGNWQRTDFIPPVSALVRPPGLASSATGIILSWSGRDAGGSGVERCELQYSVNGGPWTPHFLPDPTVTSTPFVSSTGDTTAFRVRAVDAAGNAERWVASPAGEGQTTFYRERYAGRVFDNRRTGIPGVQVLGSTRPDIPFISDPTGAYEAYTFDGFYYLRVAHPAYGALPDVNPPGWSVTERVDISLPPKKNAVQNGGFEQSGEGWEPLGSSGGDYPYGSGHSGLYAARLGSGYPAGTVGIRQQITVPPR